MKYTYQLVFILIFHTNQYAVKWRVDFFVNFEELMQNIPILINMGSHMKTTLDLADPLFHAAKAMAAQQQTTLRALVEEGLRLVMAQRKQSAAKPYKLEDYSVGGKQISPYNIQQINDDYAMERFHRANVYLQEDLEMARLRQANQADQQNEGH
jgi:hypothetical protein